MVWVVKIWIGHSGPRTDEKWRISGIKGLRGRVSMIAATFPGVCGTESGLGIGEGCTLGAGVFFVILGAS